jgi:hypothetical protein
MTTRRITVLGLPELEKKLDAEFLAQPELEDARDTFVGRIQRGGKGLGAQRNELSAVVRPLGATVFTTLNYPRTKGTSWGRKNEAIVKAMAPRVIKKAARRIEERWGK